jgi:RNA polymerase sigma-70 factor (ECF subfamily)
MEMVAEATDLDLLRSGDTAALVRRYYGPVLGLARRMLGDPAAAGDAAQETFARAIAHLGRFDPSRSFRAWLFTIAANYIRDLLRKKSPVPLDRSALDEIPDLSLPDAGLLQAERRETLSAAIDRLPFDLKIVVVLHFQQELGAPEIARVLGVSANAVRIRIYRALKLLREGLS